MRVAVLDDIHHAYEVQPAIERLRERAEVRVFTEPFGDPEVLRGYDAVIANRERTRFTADLLARLADVELICNTGNHAYHVDVPAATAAGIALVLASGASPETAGRATAELTLALMLAALRQIPRCDRALRSSCRRSPDRRRR